jgi:hypothetical protein
MPASRPHPNSRFTKEIRAPLGLRDAPDPGKRLHLQAGVASKLRVLNHEI